MVVLVILKFAFSDIHKDEKTLLITNKPRVIANVISHAPTVETDKAKIQPSNRIYFTNREGDLNVRSCASHTCSIVTTLEKGSVFIYPSAESASIPFTRYKMRNNNYTYWLHVEIPAGLNCVNKPDNDYCHAGVSDKSWGWVNQRYISKYDLNQ